MGNGNASSVFSGTIQDTTGTIALVKTGTGTLTLAGADTYTGGTTISGGTLLLNNAAAVQDSTVTVSTSNGLRFGTGITTFTLGGLAGSSSFALADSSGAGVAVRIGNDNASTSYSGVLSGSGSLTKIGTGTLTLAGSETYTGGTVVSAGTLALNVGGPIGTLAPGSNVTVNAGAVLQANHTDVLGYNYYSTNAANLIVNDGTVYVSSGYRLTLSNTVTMTGGSLSSATGNGDGSGNYSLDGQINATSDANGNPAVINATQIGLQFSPSVFNVTRGAANPASDLIISSVISSWYDGTGLMKTGNGILTLSGSNTFDGGVTLSAGQLNINNASALGTGTFTISGGTIGNTSGHAITLSTNNAQDWDGSFAFVGPNDLNLGTGPVALGGSYIVTVTAANLTVGGPISDGCGCCGPDSLTKAGAGTLTLGGSNTFDGGMILSAGQLNINNASALGTGTFTISGGTIGNTSGHAITLSTNNAQSWNGDFYFVGPNDLNLGTGTVTLGGNRTVTVTADDLTVGGRISGGSYGLTKAGAGTLTLTGSSTYRGVTTINGGLLAVNGSLRSSGSVAVNNTGILGGTGSVGNVVVNAGGTVEPGTGGEGTLSLTSLSLSTGSVLDYVLGTGTGHDGFLAVSGGVSLPGGGVTLNLTDGGFLTVGTYHLMSYGSLSGTPSTAFTVGVTPPSVAGDHFSFQTETGSTNYLDLVILASTTSGMWVAPGSGSWATGSNWENSFIPTKEGDTATFGTSIGSNAATVTLDGNRTLSGLTFNNTLGGSYLIASTDGSTLTLDNGLSAVSLNNNGGNHVISAPVTINSNVAVSAAPGSSLTLSGGFSGNSALSLSVDGGGAMVLSGTGVQYNGNVNVINGTLQVVNTWTGGPGASPNTQFGFSVGPASAANTLNIGPNGVLELYVDDTSVYQGDHGSNGSLGTQAGTTITGNGILRKTGNGILGFENYAGPAVAIDMSGGTIDIEGGTLRQGGWGGRLDQQLGLAVHRQWGLPRPLGGQHGVCRCPSGQWRRVPELRRQFYAHGYRRQ